MNIRCVIPKCLIISLALLIAFTSLPNFSFANDYPTEWRLERIFESNDAFKETLEQFQNNDLEQLKTFKGKLTSDEQLLECLKLYEALNITASKLYVYTAMMQDMDSTNTLYLENKSLGLMAVSALEEAGSFLVPEILLRTDEEIDRAINNPSFGHFVNYLTGLKQSRAYYFDENSERILALSTPLSEMPSEIYTQLTISDAQYGEFTNHKGGVSEFDPEWDTIYLYSTDANMREKAFEAYYSPYINSANTLASIYIAEVHKNSFFSKARGYSSSLEAALDGTIDPEQYKALVKAARDNAPLLQRYIELKKSALGLTEFRMSDMHLPYTTELAEAYDYESGADHVIKALEPLGADYSNRLKDFLSSGSIDVYPNTYKTTSQYSWGAYDSPVFVLLNYNDSYDDVSTLAHELGHAMHQTLIQENQPYFDASVPSFPAEVTSILNELHLSDYFQSTTENPEAKLLYTTKELDNIFYTFFEQVLLADFEMQVHETLDNGEALSLETLNALWMDTAKMYYGDSVIMPDYYAYHWMTIPHLYQNHYVYSYAMSFAAAQKIKENLDTGDADQVDAYLDFLTRGGSESPLDSLSRIGVDFDDNQLYDAVFSRMSFLIDDINNQLSEIGDSLTSPPYLLSNEEIESVLSSNDRPLTTASETEELTEDFYWALGMMAIGLFTVMGAMLIALLLTLSTSAKRKKQLKACEAQLHSHYRTQDYDF